MTPTDDFTSESNRWQAVIQRNPQAYDKFVFGVVTTGIYCRPTCSSRKPNRENVLFFDNGKTAEQDGFRPCKRCCPQFSNAANMAVERITQVCKIIENAKKEQSLKELALSVGLSPSHFHRLFKRTVGVTPKQYAIENRLQRVRNNLQRNSTVTETVYAAGFESSSRFYETATRSLGMKPSAYKKGGAGISIRYAIIQSYLGWVLIAATEQGICKIDIDAVPEILRTRLKADFPEANLQDNDPEFRTIIAQTLSLLEAPEQGLSLPLDIQGTAFQRRVWATLQTIPPGSTASYAEVAKMIGKPKAARAVARACAANHIAVAIPCHRVVRGNGDLAGYRWGIERKQAILDRESHNVD
jgi:AraC family transcriptional regulator of adaptative response/methylated-DNA-[protein]-cysteine methyltransferase